MLNAIRGRYRNGTVELEEDLLGQVESDVLVVFLDPMARHQTQRSPERLGGALSDVVHLPEDGDTDPVAEALSENRQERHAAIASRWPTAREEA